MNLFDLFEFFFRFNISASDAATWIYTFLAVLAVILLFGFVWGKLWNRGWDLTAHRWPFVLVILSGLAAGYAVLNLKTVKRMDEWFKGQRMTLARSIADSGKFNRSVLITTWTELYPKLGQDGLVPPDQGGNELRLNTPEDAYALSVAAAEEVRTTLRARNPFSIGLPLATRSSEDIGTETVDAVQFNPSRYPTVVKASNEWCSTAATIQTNHALDTALATLKPGMEELKTSCTVLLIVALLLPALVIPVAALNDIKINPTPKR